jgi:signal transduction histidine kinase
VEIVAADVGDIEMQVDEDQIFRVVSNLVRNARQVLAAGKGGQITLQGSQEADGWTITVRDNGPGLPPKALEHIFKPFEGNVRKGGTGLGLAISAELVGGHGGKLKLVDNSDQGAAFQMWLPK